MMADAIVANTGRSHPCIWTEKPDTSGSERIRTNSFLYLTAHNGSVCLGNGVDSPTLADNEQ